MLTRADGCISCCSDSCASTPTPTPFFDDQGRRIFQVNGGVLKIVVEGAIGLSRAQVAASTQPVPPDNRPDLQIETTQGLGNASPAVCDIGPTSAGGGGVFGISVPDFTLEPSAGPAPGTISGALADFACRFSYSNPGFQCTYWDPATPGYVSPGSSAQFCDQTAANAAFNPGDSILTVRLRDVNGNIGPTKQIVVRVNTPMPTRTP